MSGRSVLNWFLALAVTLGAAAYQRRTGPTYPFEAAVVVGDRVVQASLPRAHAGDGDQPVIFDGVERGVSGRIHWRRTRVDEPFHIVQMRSDGGRLSGMLPHQPPAGKLEYKVELAAGEDTIFVPSRGTVVTRFKGAVPVVLLVPHILFMFLAMFFSNLAGVEAVRREPGLRVRTVTTLLFLVLGGFVFGPIVQKYAFGSWWTGFPFGFDLTDNKTLLALIGWAGALRSFRRGGSPRLWVLAAALVMLVIFLVPHSLLGSELKQE